jgi:hypothetical protein
MKPHLAVFFCFSFLAGAAACGDDDHHHSHDSGTTAVPQACQDITDACHDVDMGSGPAHDCHENAHAFPIAERCEADRAMCLAVCLGDAGAPSDASTMD